MKIVFSIILFATFVSTNVSAQTADYGDLLLGEHRESIARVMLQQENDLASLPPHSPNNQCIANSPELDPWILPGADVIDLLEGAGLSSATYPSFPSVVVQGSGIDMTDWRADTATAIELLNATKAVAVVWRADGRTMVNVPVMENYIEFTNAPLAPGFGFLFELKITNAAFCQNPGNNLAGPETNGGCHCRSTTCCKDGGESCTECSECTESNDDCLNYHFTKTPAYSNTNDLNHVSLPSVFLPTLP